MAEAAKGYNHMKLLATVQSIAGAYDPATKAKYGQTTKWIIGITGSDAVTTGSSGLTTTTSTALSTMSKPKSKQEEALQFLDDLDSMTPEGAPTGGTTNEAEVLAFMDEITQKSVRPAAAPNADRPNSRAGTPNLRKSTERVRLGGGPISASSSTGSLGRTSDKARAETASAAAKPAAQGAGAAGGWGWGSVWSAASAAVQQAKTVVDEQVKQLPSNEQAKKWREGVLEYAKSAQLDKLGMLEIPSYVELDR